MILTLSRDLLLLDGHRPLFSIKYALLTYYGSVPDEDPQSSWILSYMALLNPPMVHLASTFASEMDLEESQTNLGGNMA